MSENAIDEQILIARATARHIRDLRSPTPSIEHSKLLEFPAGKHWIELRTDKDEVCGIYRYFQNSGQLRRE